MLQTKFRKTALLAALLSALSGSALADGDDAGQGVYSVYQETDKQMMHFGMDINFSFRQVELTTIAAKLMLSNIAH